MAPDMSEYSRIRSQWRAVSCRVGLHYVLCEIAMMKNLLITSGTALLLSACATTTPPPRGSVKAIKAVPLSPVGLERVIGQDARGLVSLFGVADQDVPEASARKLQFGSGICILDAYLYPPSKGREPVVTYFDTRQPDGKAIDRASCVAALTRRKEAR
jgi:hypothetical protein